MNTPVFTTSSCEYCPRLDTVRMVQCDLCDLWYHFECVGVDETVAKKDWSCDKCKHNLTQQSSRDDKENQLSGQSWRKSRSVRSFSSVSTERSKDLALKQLEEERELTAKRDREYLQRKYRILEGDDEYQEHNDDFDKTSYENTLRWAKEVQNVSKDFSNKLTMDDISISINEKERHALGLSDLHSLSSQNVQQSKRPSFRFGDCQFQSTEVPANEPLQSNKEDDKFKLNRTTTRQADNASKPIIRRSKLNPERNMFNDPQQRLINNPNVDPFNFGATPKTIFTSTKLNRNDDNKHKSHTYSFDTFHQPKKSYAEINPPKMEFSSKRHAYDFGHIPKEPQSKEFRSSKTLLNNTPKMSFDKFDFSSNKQTQRNNQQSSNQMNFTAIPEPGQFGQFGDIPSGRQIPINQNYVPEVGQPVNYKLLCKTNVELTATHIATRHTMNKRYPQFSGEPTMWQMFESAFVNATVSCGLTNSENLSRLMDCLKGDAFDAVKCRLLHSDNVPGVMETLRLMYGRPELIIQKLLEEINDTASPESDDLGSLVKFAISVQNLCSTVKTYGALEHLRNPTLIKALTDKLPTQIQLNWAFYKFTAGDVNLSTLGDWLYGLATIASDVVTSKPTSQNNKKVQRQADSSKTYTGKSQNYINVQNGAKMDTKSKISGEISSKNPKKCPACNKDICKALAYCEVFKKLNRQDKWKLIKTNNLCGCCLGNHRYFNCNQKIPCGIAGCTYFHHVLLHNDIKVADETKQSSNCGNNQKKTCNSTKGTVQQSEFPDIFRIVPVNLIYNGKSKRIFVYLDDGSNVTTLHSSIARELQLHGTKESLCVKWSFGETQVESDSNRVSVQISGVHQGAEIFLLDNVRTVHDLELPMQSITKNWLDQYPHFENIPIISYKNAIPQMIIGLQYSKLTVSLETIEGSWEQPIVCRTRLGWVVQGPNDRNICSVVSKRFSLNICECHSVDNDLHQLVKGFFSLESLDVKISDRIVESKELTRARNILESSIIRRDNHYEVGLLWHKDGITLPDSYDMARRRLECVESKMNKNSILATRMCDYINDFLSKRYIRKLNARERQLHGPRTWYLPVFPVFYPKKPEKLRMVWDGAAKVKGISLNSQLMAGPDQLIPLPDILRRFREGCIGLSTDIIEMFHRVSVNEEDQDSQRFLWRDGDITKEPEVFVIKVLPFGLACSPAIAQTVKNKNAKEFEHKYPRAVQAITKNHYVDDMIERAHDVETAVKLIKDVQFIHKHANFDLRNLISNNQQVLEAINGSPEFNDKILVDKTDINVERILGMYWHTKFDTFTYSLQFIKLEDITEEYYPTKREVLRIVMSVFDPLGFLAHLLIHAKVLLQEIWRHNIGWDERLPLSLKCKWLKWIRHLKQVESLHIPRLFSPRMSPNIPKSIQLHIFVDASLEAYASSAYFRIEDNGGVDSCFVGAKSRVAPNKPMSVPRLELQGAVLGNRFAENILKSHYDLNIEKTVIWCDSKTVLYWLNNEPRRYSQFVAFRIGEILDSKITIQWRWIPSEFNVADEATKTKNLPELQSSSRWFVGPEFLRDQNNDFSFELDEPNFTTDEEVRPYYLLAHLEVPIRKLFEYERFANWLKLLRTTTYVLRFIRNTKQQVQERIFDILSSEELLAAENLLYRQVQYDCFQEEILIVRWNETATLDKQKEFSKISIIRTCSPYLDQFGVLRVMSRLDNAHSISESAKRPIILPKEHYVTHLIVDWYHRKYRHLHHQTVLNEIRQKFWIPKLRVVLKGIRNKCQKCKNSATMPRIPEMDAIPKARLAVFTRCFTFTGVDYFGPLHVIVNRGTQKRWGVLFTCMTTRAVHLEIAHSMDTSSCIMAIRNFIGRRGSPRQFFSDNGTNFHGANNVFIAELANLDYKKIREEFITSEIDWSFNPPKAAHMGGVWERMVGIVKTCLDEVLTVRYPTDEMLKNLFIEVESIVNSRPLTYVSLESPDDEVLTPNHFLLGSSNGTKPPGEFVDADLLRNNWRTIQTMSDKFWQKFVDEYLPTLMQRSKWLQKVEPLKIGDVVLLVDASFQRNTWPKGIVIETFKDKTDQVRSARVRTATGTIFHRPVSHLAILDVKQPGQVDSTNLIPLSSSDSRHFNKESLVKQMDSVNGEENVENARLN